MISRRIFIGSASAAITGSVVGHARNSLAQGKALTGGTGTIMEPARAVPIVQECDVCVLGGSCTGVFAAVRAAQSGAKVAIVEKQNAFGGMATAGLVNKWHKLYDNERNQHIIEGLTWEVIQKLDKIGAVKMHAEGKGDFDLNTEELKIELDRLVLENGITPYLHTHYVAADIQNGSINAVFIENKNGRQAIKAKVFVDATGDGDLAAAAGLPFEIRDGLQPPTTCADVYGLPGNIRKLIDQHREEFGLALDHGWGAGIPGAQHTMMCAFTHAFGTLASDATQLTAAEIEGRRQIRAYMDIARKYGEQNNKPCLLDLASSIGIRETRSFTANYRLTEQDVMEGKRFPDAIANGTYPIDVHDPDTGKFKFKRPKGNFYQIPLSILVNEKAPNLVMAGRMICTDRSAFGGVRVMVNLNQTGEAAGVTAALAVAKKAAVSKVEAKAVRKELSNLGAIII